MGDSRERSRATPLKRTPPFSYTRLTTSRKTNKTRSLPLDRVDDLMGSRRNVSNRFQKVIPSSAESYDRTEDDVHLIIPAPSTSTTSTGST